MEYALERAEDPSDIEAYELFGPDMIGQVPIQNILSLRKAAMDYVI